MSGTGRQAKCFRFFVKAHICIQSRPPSNEIWRGSEATGLARVKIAVSRVIAVQQLRCPEGFLVVQPNSAGLFSGGKSLLPAGAGGSGQARRSAKAEACAFAQLAVQVAPS